MMLRVNHILIGRAVSLTDTKHMSGIYKMPCLEPVWLSSTGLAGDEQADKKHHGGLEKALHHYPFEHYANWARQLKHSVLNKFDKPGVFGENISTIGMTEADVCIGDVFKLGEATIQISQGRQPCWKLDARINHKGIAKMMQTSGATGWYYRVQKPGLISQGDTLTLLDRPEPNWPLNRLITLLFDRRLEQLNDWASASQIETLSENWRRCFAKRVESKQIEDWSARLNNS